MSEPHYDMPPTPLSAEEAAEAMISEGAPLDQPHGRAAQSPTYWDEVVEYAEASFHQTVKKHPLESLLVAFGLGLIVGGVFRRD
jgi:hypothetical protein